MLAIAHGNCTDIVRELCTESSVGRKRPLPKRGIEPSPVLRLAFRSDALPTELPRPTRALLLSQTVPRSIHSLPSSEEREAPGRGLCSQQE